MAAKKAPEVGSGWRRVKSGHRYRVTNVYCPSGTRDPWTVELTPEPGETGRRTWLSPAGFAAKFEATPPEEAA